MSSYFLPLRGRTEEGAAAWEYSPTIYVGIDCGPFHPLPVGGGPRRGTPRGIQINLCCNARGIRLRETRENRPRPRQRRSEYLQGKRDCGCKQFTTECR